jgi:hypothetical protein
MTGDLLLRNNGKKIIVGKHCWATMPSDRIIARMDEGTTMTSDHISATAAFVM